MVHLVVLVAGMSSRFGGKPKQMAKVGPNNETLIEYSIDQALQYPFNKIIFVTNDTTEHLFVNIFGEEYRGRKVCYVQQTYDKNIRIRPWGTVDCLSTIINHVVDPFIMINGDDIYGKQTFEKGYELLLALNDNIIGGLQMDKTLPENGGKVNRGQIKINSETGTVTHLEELYNVTVAASRDILESLANVNFIGLTPDTLQYIKLKVDIFKETNKNDPTIEACLSNILEKLINENKIKINYFEITTEIIGITNPEDEQAVKNKLYHQI